MEQKNAIALNEMNSNEEPTVVELSKTRVPHMCAYIWNSD